MNATVEITQSLEWIYGKTRIQVTVRKTVYNTQIDVDCYPNYSRSAIPDRFIRVMASISDKRIKIEDLQGNNFASGFQNQGYGTLMVNILLQQIRVHLFNDGHDFEDPKWVVSADISRVGDPDEEPKKTECRERRVHFWRRFGLSLPQGITEGRTECPLRTMKTVGADSGRMIATRAPLCPDLGDFWKSNSLPALLPGTPEAVNDIDYSALSLDGLPDSHHLKATEIQLQRHWQGIHYGLTAIAVAAGLELSAWAYNLQGSVADFGRASALAVVLSLIGVWAGSEITLFLQKTSTQWKTLRSNQERLTKRIVEVASAINQIEEAHGGLLWRVEHWLSKTHPNLVCPEWTEVAKTFARQERIQGIGPVSAWLQCIRCATQNLSETRQT